MVRLDKVLSLLIQHFIPWITIITGCSSAGLRTARSPGVTVPHFVTSNVLGERSNFPPNPANSPDYDSLLEIVNGDFGIKSAVVKAATEEPVYRGAETKLLPLYIPKGAIPIKLARITRSGPSAALRIPLRRSRLPASVTGRRQGGPRRPSVVTPPPTFLRGWGRRISPKAESRLGHVEDAKTSASTPSNKKTPNDRSITSFQSIRRGTPVVTNNITTTTTTTAKTLTTNTSQSASTTAKPLRSSPIRNATVNPTSEQTATESSENVKNSPSKNLSAERKATTQSRSKAEHSKKSTKSSRGNARLQFPFSRQASERQSRISSTEASPRLESKEEAGQKKTIARKSSLQRVRETLLSRTAAENSASLDQTSRINLSKKRIQYPTRPTTTKPIIQNVEENVNPKFRIPHISRKSSRNPKNTTISTTPSSTTTPYPSIPVRKRRPLRPRIPLSGLTTSTPAPDTSTRKPDGTTFKLRKTTFRTTTPQPIVIDSFVSTTEQFSSKQDTSTTTISSVRRIHEFFEIPSNIETSTLKSTQLISSPKSSPLPAESVVRSTTSQPWTKVTSRTRPITVHPTKRVDQPLTQGTSKSAAEIVLASLSDVMRDVTTDDKDKIDKIAEDLDTLNKKLSERGILIIHAEVDGVIINLRNQTNIRNRNLLRAHKGHLEQRENDSLKESERESLEPQPLSAIEDTSTTIYTPSDKLAFDVLASDTNDEKHFFDVTAEQINEVSTTKLAKPVNVTTNKPFVKSNKHQTTAPLIASSEVSTTEHTEIEPTKSYTKANRQTEEISYSPDVISATPTQPWQIKTKSRTTVVPLRSDVSPTKYSLEIDYVSAENLPSNGEDNVEIKKFDRIEADIMVESPSNSSLLNIVLTSNEDDSIEELLEEYLDTEDLRSEEEATEESSSSSVYLVGLVGIIPLAGVGAHVVNKYLRGDSHKKALPESEERPDGFTPPTHHHVRNHSHLPPLPTDKPPKPPSSSDSSDSGHPPSLMSSSPWEFSRSKLRLVSILGEGNFGVVWKAEARGFCDYSAGGSTVLVAVKKVKETAGTKEKCDLLRELSVMQLLGPHPNVVSLLGCCTQSEPHLVIMEYVMFGKLLTFLRDHRTRHNYFNFSSDTAALTSRDLTRFACQVATGCEYLQSRGIIHRDLAARNILVDHNKVCKIADFGMARSIQDIGSDIYEQKSKGALPIRWMAPESLYMNIFTHKSDVWSFGILCWEIVTLGSTPYPGLTAREVMRQVTEGYRLERPDHCRPELYRLLATCWSQDLNKRPTFHQLRLELTTLMEHHTGYIDLENFPEEDYFLMHQNSGEKL